MVFMREDIPVPPPAVRDYRLVFCDDFTNLDLSPDGRGVHRWYEGVWYSQHRAPLSNIVSTEEGLTLTWTRGQEQPDTSIATHSQKGEKSEAWRYGYFEVRMRWNPEPGAWPAIWLLPVLAGEPQEMGELDIFEGNADHPHSYFGVIHHWRRDPADATKMIDVQNNGSSEGYALPPGTDLREFHTYGLLWEPDKVTWYFDDKPLHSEASYSIFSSQEYSLIIGMQAGAKWQLGNLEGVTAEKMSMRVSWARVWQR
jgi:hypothetical protein